MNYSCAARLSLDRNFLTGSIPSINTQMMALCWLYPHLVFDKQVLCACFFALLVPWSDSTWLTICIQERFPVLISFIFASISAPTSRRVVLFEAMRVSIMNKM